MQVSCVLQGEPGVKAEGMLGRERSLNRLYAAMVMHDYLRDRAWHHPFVDIQRGIAPPLLPPRGHRRRLGGALVATSTTKGPLLTTLLVVYPLFDAAAVLWQLRAGRDVQTPKVTEWTNVVVSVVVAGALGVTSTMSIAAALVVWGAWAIGSGIPQLITAVRNRRSGGQVPQMISGGISVVAGASFLGEGLKGAESIAGVGGFATLGGVFFLISAVRLGAVLRQKAA